MILLARLPEAEAIRAQARAALETPGRVEEELSMLRLVVLRHVVGPTFEDEEVTASLQRSPD